MKKTTILMLIPVLVILVATPALAEASVSLPTYIDLTPIFQVAITTLATIITAKLIPWIKQRATAEQYNRLITGAKTAVYAAEQIYGSDAGAQKLQYVKGKLQEMGFDVDLTAIEAAVMQLKIDMEPVMFETTYEAIEIGDIAETATATAITN